MLRKKINFYELATRLKIALPTAYMWHTKGWLPSPHKVGGRWYFFVDEIDDWENAGCPRQETSQSDPARRDNRSATGQSLVADAESR